MSFLLLYVHCPCAVHSSWTALRDMELTNADIYHLFSEPYNKFSEHFSRNCRYNTYISSQIIRRTVDICSCQWSCGRTLHKFPSCMRTLGSSESSPGAPEQEHVLEDPGLLTIKQKCSTRGLNRHTLPSACKFCTFWSLSRQDWNGFSSMSVVCSHPPSQYDQEKLKKENIYLPTPSSCPRRCVVGAARFPRVRVDHLSQLTLLFAFLTHHLLISEEKIKS